MGNDYSHTDNGNYPSGPIYNPSTPQNPQPPSGQPLAKSLLNFTKKIIINLKKTLSNMLKKYIKLNINIYLKIIILKIYLKNNLKSIF